MELEGINMLTLASKMGNRKIDFRGPKVPRYIQELKETVSDMTETMKADSVRGKESGPKRK